MKDKRPDEQDHRTQHYRPTRRLEQTVCEQNRTATKCNNVAQHAHGRIGMVNDITEKNDGEQHTKREVVPPDRVSERVEIITLITTIL